MYNEIIKEYALELGFSSVGFAPAKPSPTLTHYLRWLDEEMQGTMQFMARPDRVARRKNLDLILPDAQTFIVVTLNYHTFTMPPQIAMDLSRGRISNYAWGQDYHDLMLIRLTELARLVEQLAPSAQTRAYVDTGAILERSHAEQAQLGFVGKNTMLIHPRRGSHFFLGEIITTLPIEIAENPHIPMPGCGSCSRCITACPTGALSTPYVLDSRVCISYLTIEHKGFISSKLRSLMGNWVYGCDLCQDDCPWQRFAQPTQEPAFWPAELDWVAPPLIELLRLSDTSFAKRFHGSAIMRVKRDRLVRNACIAAANSHNPDFVPQLISLLTDSSAIVRGHAAWALSQLNAGSDALVKAKNMESSLDVQNEINAALTRL